jgi:hypothetical protein
MVEEIVHVINLTNINKMSKKTISQHNFRGLSKSHALQNMEMHTICCRIILAYIIFLPASKQLHSLRI